MNEQRVLGLIERFETENNLHPRDAEDLLLDVFSACGLPAIHRGGPGDQGVDIEFTTDQSHGGDRFAVQVKTTTQPANLTSVQAVAGAALQGNFDRWLFVSRNGFAKSAHAFASSVTLIKLELLSPADLRRWVGRFRKSETVSSSRLEPIVRAAMDQIAKHLASVPEDLPKVEWRDLERLLREAFEGIGFETELTRSTKDGGFDLRLTFVEQGVSRTHLVEVKHWSAPSRPGTGVLKHFAHVVAREGAEGGLVLSTSGFTDNAIEGLTESEHHLLRLGNDRKIISLCKTYYKINSEIWIADQPLQQLLHESTVAASALAQLRSDKEP